MIRNLLIVLPLLAGIAVAQTAEEVAKLIDERSSPVDLTSDMTMILTAKNGSRRTLTTHSVRKGDTHMILWFTAPADDRGVALLTIEKETGDEMRMWLPGFKKIRRISSSKKGGSFMGSDLSFEDLTSRTIKDYTYNLLDEETTDGVEYWTLESIPDPSLRSSYGRIVSKVRKSDAFVVQESYYDRGDELLKERTIEVGEFGQYSLPIKMLVRNVQTSHTTDIIFDNIEVDTGVDLSLFHERNLRRLP